MDTETPVCPECGRRMRPIQLTDAASAPLSYADGDAPRSVWTGRLPVAGAVRASLCPGCSRIILRGEPAAEVIPADAPVGRGDEPAPAE